MSSTLFSITPNAPIDRSVFDPQSYIIENTSSGSQITGFSLDISTALFAGLVFDTATDGSSGNDLGKPFTVDLNQGGITAASTVTKPYDGELGQLLTLSLGSFDAGDKLAFSVDVDPSRLTTSDPSAGPQGKMSGLELTGSVVTVTYANGTTQTGEVFGDGTVGGSVLFLAGTLPPAPTVTVQGTSGGTGTLTDNDATITISGGPANGKVRLELVRAVYDLFEPAQGAFEANRATNVNYVDVILGANGTATLSVDLTFGGAAAAEGGVFHIVGAVVDAQGRPASMVSDITRVRLEVPPADADGDGLSDTLDRFALDASNGGGNNLAQLGTLTLDFGTGTTPFGSGFTGVMANGTQAYTALAASGSVANGKLVVQTTTGDPYGSLNTQQNAYQLGVDTASVAAFTVASKVDNPFAGGVAVQNWRSAGVMFGAGDQDNYAKLVFHSNNGAGGIEFLVENAGTPDGTTVGLGVPTGNVAYGLFYLDVAKTGSGATATPRWTLHDAAGAQIGAGTGAAKALGGALLDAVQGDLVVGGQQSELAVGVISTSFGSSGPITAAWDSLTISTTGTPPPPPAAGVVVTQSGGATAVTEGGATDMLSVVLASQPGANVTVTVTGTADVAVAAGSGTPASSATLTFTAADWNVAQTVAVAAVNDTAVEGAETASLTFATSSGDSAYNGLPVAPVPVAVTDNDTASADADGDGLSDTLDRFALDASNGGGNNLAQLGTLTLDFGTGTTPFGSGFTGVMANGTQAYTALAASGSVANGKLVVQTTTGDPYGSLNTQQNAYQLGVDTAGVAAFTVASKVDNPFAGGVAAQNWRSAGVMFGAGDQDNYAKLVFHSNNGAGGIEFLVENAGTPDGTTVGLGVPTGNVAYGLFYLDVAKTGSGATATPRWTLHDAAGAQIGAGTGAAKALAGALLDAVQGDLVVGGQQSELAVGVISTSFGSSGPITAAWDSLTVSTTGTPPPSAVVVGGATGLSGTLGSQSWGPIDVSAKDWNGAAALVVKTTDGLGVAGGRFAGQVDYNPATGVSEMLRLDFDAPIDAATLRLARLNPADAPGKAEVGAWKAFDATGAVVGQGLLDPRGATAVAAATYDFAINPAAHLMAIELTALAYNNGPAGGPPESSDFALAQVTYLPADQVL
ncbi:beta strand repeat-containing protein [Falsiroseomonas oryzae]|uniref:beta strand repeat-containing protein n=1 Tax=Falsiroseomonas oryzae TaxID=2766473 RepID=UPI0022EA4D5F|nr:hypothetical protein [Roseomonas sp. MO-31]